MPWRHCKDVVEIRWVKVPILGCLPLPCTHVIRLLSRRRWRQIPHWNPTSTVFWGWAAFLHRHRLGQPRIHLYFHQKITRSLLYYNDNWQVNVNVNVNVQCTKVSALKMKLSSGKFGIRNICRGFWVGVGWLMAYLRSDWWVLKK